MGRRRYLGLTESAFVRARERIDPVVERLSSLARALDSALAGSRDAATDSQLGQVIAALRARCGLPAKSATAQRKRTRRASL